MDTYDLKMRDSYVKFHLVKMNTQMEDILVNTPKEYTGPRRTSLDITEKAELLASRVTWFNGVEFLELYIHGQFTPSYSMVYQIMFKINLMRGRLEMEAVDSVNELNKSESVAVTVNNMFKLEMMKNILVEKIKVANWGLRYVGYISMGISGSRVGKTVGKFENMQEFMEYHSYPVMLQRHKDESLDATTTKNTPTSFLARFLQGANDDK